MTKRVLAIFLLIVGFGVVSKNLFADQTDDIRLKPFSEWLELQTKKATEGVLANISVKDAALGSVIASPSLENPPYFFHWVRDAALVMEGLLKLLEELERLNEKETNPEKKADYLVKITDYLKKMYDYVHFSLENQRSENPSGGVGEPKFYVHGESFKGVWGRPQDDGPALRAITMIHFAQFLLKKNSQDLWVKTVLYNSIQADLKYISNRYKYQSYDSWEEIEGHHFFTRMVQRRALIEGAALANQLGDFNSESSYLEKSKILEEEIQAHWNQKKGYFVSTLNPQQEKDRSGLDVLVILGVLHGDLGDGFISVTDDRVLATAAALESAFQLLYPINQPTWIKQYGSNELGTAIGRYPEDHYDGYVNHPNLLGNPWVLTTAAFAELYYRIANQLSDKIAINQINFPFFRSLKLDEVTHFKDLNDKIQAKGDSFLKRIQFHSMGRGNLSEQINRDTGYMQGANDLTWSYMSFLMAQIHRKHYLNKK